MEKSYWLRRKRSSVANAAGADTAEARLIHLDLAGRYSIKAAVAGAEGLSAAEPQPIGLPLRLPMCEPDYYERLEIGARWLADGSSGGERDEHLAMADRYARLARIPAGRGR
jgi:hypothetical protein